METVRLTVWRFDPTVDQAPVAREYDVPGEEGTTVLQALMYVSEELDPSLAFRFGCRHERCGLCGVEVDGRPRLACLTKIKDGMVVKPLGRVPLIRDLTVDRSWFYNTLQRLELYVDVEAQSGFRMMTESPEHQQVEQCTECFCCLSTCPTYDFQNQAVGGPFHFVKLAQMHFHPLNRLDRRAQAASLGVDRCAECHECYCVTGIPIFKGAIAPLLTKNGA